MSLYLSGGTKYELAGCSNGSVWRFETASGDVPTGVCSANVFEAGVMATGQPIDFTQFLDTGIFLDGLSAVTWNGTNSAVITALPSAGISGAKYGELHLNKFFVAGIAGALSSVAYGPTGAIYSAWIGTGTDQFQVEQNDGTVVTGLKSFASNELVIFKDRSMWKLLGDLADNFALVSVDKQVGCVSNRTIQLYQGVLIWANRDGVYVYDGSSPRKISSYVQDIWDTVNMARAGFFTSTIDTKRGLYLISVTTDANTANNLTLAFDAKHPWTDSEGLHFPCFPWRVPAQSYNQEIDTGSIAHLVMGGTAGWKYYFSDDLYQDNGTSFEWVVDTPLMPFNDGIGNENCLRRVYVPYKNTSGTIEFYTEIKDGGGWVQHDSISTSSPAAAIGVDFIIGVSPVGADTITGTARINANARSRRIKARFRNLADERVQIDAPVEFYFKRGGQRG
jgi:hypothetical protein